jgi:hypothetical protein
MKITLEFEHSHELIDLLKSLGSNLKEDEPTIGKEYKFEILDEFKTLDSNIKSTFTTESLQSLLKVGEQNVNAKDESKLTSYELLYKNLLEELGCNGHPGAVAEIRLLRKHL